MAKRGKKYKSIKEKVQDKDFGLDEAVKKAKENDYANFKSTLDLHVALNLPKDKEAKSIKGTVSLPNPVKAQETRIIVFCEEEQAEAAKKAGAAEAGLEKLIKKVQEGLSDFDVVLATPQVMSQIAILGKDLGPKGLMPNPKTGTLVEDVEQAVEEFRKGKSKFACDEGGVIHMAVGKEDMDNEKVTANIKAAIAAIIQAVGKPSPTLLKSVSIAPTMGPAVKIDMGGLLEK